jgi:hypothetical protein
MIITLIVIVIIIALIFILTLLMGNEMKIERVIIIGKPAKQVFDYVKITKNQDYFSIWNMSDPEMKKEYQGTDGQVGFVYKWDSIRNKNVGAGEQKLRISKKVKVLNMNCAFPDQ